MLIVGCPLDVIPAGTWDVLDMADLLEKGLPPVAGGMLDQTVQFVQAVRVVWNERARWKNKAPKWQRGMLIL
tara:strand:- start:247 stop:462 length:216 start_codon:yes stop_codon:yes gene_type:complete